MKSRIFALTLFAFASAAASTDVSPELTDARKRYDAGLAAATKPIRDRYIQELQQLKSRALSLKKLDVALAIDAEIKAVAPKDSAAETLCANIWTLRRDKLEFQRDGKLIQRGAGWVGKDWKLSDDGTQVTIKFTNGNGGTFKIENGAMTHFDGTPFQKTPRQ